MATIEDQPTYNLGVVVQETGIKPDTLRAWERRYGLPDPERSDGGHRLYSRNDIQTVKWLLDRQEEGLRIGQAVNLWRELKAAGREPLVEHPLQEVSGIFSGRHAGRRPAPSGETLAGYQASWLEAVLAFEEQKAEQILTDAFTRFSLETVWEKVIAPALADIGEGWAGNSLTVQQEHFASSLVIRRLNAMLEAAPPPIRERTVLISCPPGEEHTFSALLLTYYLRRRGYPVVYLGANVPLQDLDRALETVRPDLVVMVAQTLATAGSLDQSARQLHSADVLFAYAGRIFDRLPDLTGRVPGYYLGTDFHKAADRVESILSKDPEHQPEGTDLPEEYNQELDAWQGMDLLIMDTVIKRALAKGYQIEEIIPANQHLRQGLEASLRLGNLDYLRPDLLWLEELLSGRGMSQDMISEYLVLFAEAVRLHLGDTGERIAAWLEGVDQELK